MHSSRMRTTHLRIVPGGGVVQQTGGVVHGGGRCCPGGGGRCCPGGGRCCPGGRCCYPLTPDHVTYPMMHLVSHPPFLCSVTE